jgi:hypothetical protein
MKEQATTTLAIETDTALAALYYRKAALGEDISGDVKTLDFYTKKAGKGALAPWDAEAVKRTEAGLAIKRAEMAEIKKAMEPLEAIYEAHRWTRAFLVVQSHKGHVHSSMHCSTCYPTTAFVWLPKYSGESETKIVADAGERACTICYPSAPVDAKGTVIFSEDEIAAAKRKAEKAEAKIAKDAKKAAAAPTKSGAPLTIIEVSTGWDGKSHSYKRSLATEITAKSEYVSMAQSIAWSKWPQDIEAKKVAMAQIAEALAEKHGVTIEEEIAALAKKVAAKNRKDGG